MLLIKTYENVIYISYCSYSLLFVSSTKQQQVQKSRIIYCQAKFITNLRAYSNRARALLQALLLANGWKYPFPSGISSRNPSGIAWCEWYRYKSIESFQEMPPFHSRSGLVWTGHKSELCLFLVNFEITLQIWKKKNYFILPIHKHPAGTSEISDWNGDVTNFWPIEVNGRNLSGIFLLKNQLISQRFQHPFWKLVYSLKVLCVGICYQNIFKCNWARTQRKVQFCLTTAFLSISNFWHVCTNWFKPVETVVFNK